MIEKWKIKVAKYFLLNLKYDFLTAAIGLILAFVSLRTTGNSLVGFILTVSITLVSLMIIIWLRVRERTFYYLPLRVKGNDDGWIGIGTYQYRKTEEAFLITDSEAGYIFSKCFDWVDYRMEFDFRIVKKYLGVILKATNLSNYAMIQINQHGIRPHIRVNGGWKAWEADTEGLEFKEKLSFDTWYRCIISTEGKTIIIKILEGDKVLFNREWDIPQGTLAFLFKRDESDPGLPIPYPINLEYGSFGFRNAPTEVGLVRDLLVEKI